MKGHLADFYLYFHRTSNYTAELTDYLRKSLSKAIDKQEGEPTKWKEIPIERGSIQVIHGPNSLHYEMGRIDQTQGANIVVYTDDRNFLSKDFLKHRQTKTSNRLSDKRVNALCNDILETQSEKGNDILKTHSQKANIILETHSQKGNVTIQKTIPYPISEIISTKATTSSKIQKEEVKIHPDSRSVQSANNWRESVRHSVVYTSSRLGESTVASDTDYILKETNMKFKTDKIWRKSLVDFLMKMPNYFNKKNENESIKFINALENLVNQHIAKFEKGLQHPLDSKEKENYFLWIRNYLYEKEVVSGTIHDFWVNTEHGDSKDKMLASNSTKINFEKLKEVIEREKENKDKFSMADYELKANIRIYALIFFAVLKSLLKQELWKSDNPINNEKGLYKCIHHKLKNYYSSAKISEDQKKVIRKDKRMKYLVADYLRSKGVWTLKGTTLTINPSKVSSFLEQFNSEDPSEMVRIINRQIDKLIMGGR